MRDILLFALLGLGSGALIAGIALAIVLTYRGSGIINLATGGIAMLAGYSYWSLKTGEYGTEFGGAGPRGHLRVHARGGRADRAGRVQAAATRRRSPSSSSLGVLLVAQASMLLAFGTTQKPQPSILPSDTVTVFDVNVPVDRFILAGTVIGIAVALSVLYRFTRFGLATRAASENELSALLAGLSANELSMVNTLLASLVAGTVGAGRVGHAAGRPRCRSRWSRRWRPLLARLTSFAIACGVGLGIGILNSLIDYWSSKSWFPTDHGVPLPGAELVAFLIIITAMFLRGAALPGRGELIEQRLPEVRPQRLATPAIVLTIVCALALVVLPFDFRQALINSLIGTVMALSLVVITGFVGQISVVQLSLAGWRASRSPTWPWTPGSDFRWRPCWAPAPPCCSAC